MRARRSDRKLNHADSRRSGEVSIDLDPLLS